METLIRSYSANIWAILELILINFEVSYIKAQSEWLLRSFAETQEAEKAKDEVENTGGIFRWTLQKFVRILWWL